MNGSRVLLYLCMVCLAAGCSIEPWVAPYERGLLAEPIMQFNRDPLGTQYREHVYETREGAQGGGFTTGIGCGCN